MKRLILVFAAVLIVTEGSKLEMPSFASIGDHVAIECKLDHDQHPIEHIKWYKNNQLFYTVVPSNEPPVTNFNLPGIEFDISESRQDRIVLKSVNAQSSGLYTCELKLENGMARMSGTLTVFPSKE